jgi:hypothetical protein
VQLRRVDGVVVLPDVLAHLDAGDGVEGAVGDLAVVLQPDLDPVGQSELRDAGEAECPLLGGQRDAHGRDAVVRRGVDEQRGPAAADVQQPHPRPEAELAADQVQLVPLRVGEGGHDRSCAVVVALATVFAHGRRSRAHQPASGDSVARTPERQPSSWKPQPW